MLVLWFSQLEQSREEGLLPSPAYQWPTWHISQRTSLHQDWSLSCLPPCVSHIWRGVHEVRFVSFQRDSLMPHLSQRFMNDIFSDMLDISVIVYLDNILIYSNGNLSKHHMLIHMLHSLCKHKLFTKMEKCAFHTNIVEYNETQKGWRDNDDEGMRHRRDDKTTVTTRGWDTEGTGKHDNRNGGDGMIQL